MKIDITMISTIRPEIVRHTLQSLVKYVGNPEGMRLIIDIAPVGEKGKTQEDILQIAKTYFKEVIARANHISYQTEALIWTWKQATSDFILNWEDDWEAVQFISVPQLIDVFHKYPKLAAINFDREGKSIINYKGYSGQFKHLERSFYQRKKDYGLAGPPALIKKSYIEQALKYINPLECLDITSQKVEVRKFLDTWDHITIAKLNCAFVRDIGHEWKKKHGIKRIKNSEVGVKWIKAS